MPVEIPDDELQKMPHTKARKFKPQPRLEPALLSCTCQQSRHASHIHHASPHVRTCTHTHARSHVLTHTYTRARAHIHIITRAHMYAHKMRARAHSCITLTFLEMYPALHRPPHPPPPHQFRSPYPYFLCYVFSACLYTSER